MSPIAISFRYNRRWVWLRVIKKILQLEVPYIPPQEAEAIDKEGNVHYVSVVQKIFNVPEVLNLPRQAFDRLS